MNNSTAYIGLGSNLNNPIEQLKTARQTIAQLSGVTELAFSSLYSSPPMPGSPPKQPDYINAVMAVATNLAPLTLLQQLQTIENKQGRLRATRWGARTLDVDLLLYDDQVIDLPHLIVPHIGLAQRAFVLYPLFEIAPQLVIPNQGNIADLLTHCPLAGLQRLTPT